MEVLERRSFGPAYALAAGVLLCTACAGDDSSAASAASSGTISGSATDDATASQSSGSSADDTGPPPAPPPVCTGTEVACGTICAELQTDPNNCGVCGRTCVIPNASSTCSAGECGLGSCDPGFSDCDGDLVSGCEVAIECQDGAICETRCGSEGTTDCTDVCAAAGEPQCLSPAETCNVIDDDCNGSCDEGQMEGCRVGVHRSNSPTLGHFYTTDVVEASSGDLNLEAENYFYLYAPGVEGLMPLFRCIKANGNRWLTTSTECEGGVAPELTVGFIAAEERCGSTPLYRLRNPGPDFHFYTVSAAERDNAVNNLGFEDQGLAGHVWSGP